MGFAVQAAGSDAIRGAVAKRALRRAAGGSTPLAATARAREADRVTIARPTERGPLAQHDKDRTQIRNASTHLRRSTSPSRRCVAHRISGADVRACGDTSRPLSCGAGAPKDAARVQPPAVHRRVMRLTCPANLCCAQYCRTPGAMRCGDPALLLAASAGKPYARRRVQLS